MTENRPLVTFLRKLRCKSLERGDVIIFCVTGDLHLCIGESDLFAAGKKIGLFDSYGWGDGQWMRDWVQRMQDAGAEVYGGEDAIYMSEPDADAEERLVALGKEIAAL